MQLERIKWITIRTPITRRREAGSGWKIEMRWSHHRMTFSTWPMFLFLLAVFMFAFILCTFNQIDAMSLRICATKLLHTNNCGARHTHTRTHAKWFWSNEIDKNEKMRSDGRLSDAIIFDAIQCHHQSVHTTHSTYCDFTLGLSALYLSARSTAATVATDDDRVNKDSSRQTITLFSWRYNIGRRMCIAW